MDGPDGGFPGAVVADDEGAFRGEFLVRAFAGGKAVAVRLGGQGSREKDGNQHLPHTPYSSDV